MLPQQSHGLRYAACNLHHHPLIRYVLALFAADALGKIAAGSLLTLPEFTQEKLAQSVPGEDHQTVRARLTCRQIALVAQGIKFRGRCAARPGAL